MAVAFDAIGQYGSAGLAGNFSNSSPNNIQWNHTCTGSNLLLVVGVSTSSDNGPDSALTTTATYNGTSMTPATIAISPGPPTSDTKVHANNSNAGYAQLFYLIAPTAGTNQVQVTVTGGGALNFEIIANSLSFTGVDQTTGLNNAVGIYGSSGSTGNLAVTSATGNMVVDVICCGSSMNNAPSNQTAEWENDNTSSSGAGNAKQSIGSGASSVNVGYTGFGGDWWALIGANIIAAATSPANTAPVSWVTA